MHNKKELIAEKKALDLWKELQFLLKAQSSSIIMWVEHRKKVEDLSAELSELLLYLGSRGITNFLHQEEEQNNEEIMHSVELYPLSDDERKSFDRGL